MDTHNSMGGIPRVKEASSLPSKFNGRGSPNTRHKMFPQSIWSRLEEVTKFIVANKSEHSRITEIGEIWSADSRVDVDGLQSLRFSQKEVGGEPYGSSSKCQREGTQYVRTTRAFGSKTIHSWTSSENVPNLYQNFCSVGVRMDTAVEVHRLCFILRIRILSVLRQSLHLAFDRNKNLVKSENKRHITPRLKPTKFEDSSQKTPKGVAETVLESQGVAGLTRRQNRQMDPAAGHSRGPTPGEDKLGNQWLLLPPPDIEADSFAVLV